MVILSIRGVKLRSMKGTFSCSLGNCLNGGLGSLQEVHIWQSVIDDTGSVEGIDAFIYCTKWRSGAGQVSRRPYGLTHSQL